ncbi:ribonucleotide reductase B subunit [Elephant endotheliotropic herpesvirus 1A]|uniref:ribonucleoside-diphosphate reductase n=4 Tax=Elephantid herpesvirus 1 TaxID=146015 RepID=E2IL01_ELHV1|nr:ribonucleotide reductase subunit 2 [Elephantid betaherpesvirus 1]ADK70788.2 ribonucleotide reductase B subunit [Elephant endotheliotropic herpesvirus 1A]ADK70864.2 ribonucleotide reductase B subunit [Elephant endotheliotropic herpesvirus 1B]ADK70827.2 ribonucleotide reductase B subunit [Elephant endotheliotropic herpesvirus 1A]ADK70894.2 ribonucleotide reductase B subunit [Elephant endotheliotropic herpesvirus 1B]AGE10040.1 ribonucleotide reductase subunit 2 [Elephantid betaherpesvirus 1]
MSKYIYTSVDNDFRQLYKTVTENRWLENQISFLNDFKHVVLLDEKTKEYYRFIFCFLGMAEHLVNFNLFDMIDSIRDPDVMHYYVEQMSIECVHARTYRRILDIFYDNDESAIMKSADVYLKDPALRKKIDFLERTIKECDTLAKKIIVLMVIEGIFFLSSFISISLLRTIGFDGTTEANTYICRDESIHTTAARKLYLNYVKIEDRPSYAFIYELFSNVIKIEKEFITAKVEGVGLINKRVIFDTLEGVADQLLAKIGMQPLYATPIPGNCPLPLSTIEKNVCFFEKRNTEYCTRLTNDL